MAASHRAAAAVVVLMIVSLLVAVTLSGADARPAVRPDKTAASLGGADDVRRTGDNTKLAERRDGHGPPGYVAAAAAVAVAPDVKLVKPECEDEDDEEEEPKHQRSNIIQTDPDENPKHDDDSGELPYYPQPEDPAMTGTESDESSELDQELCSDCEQPKKPQPQCNTCEEPEMTCNKVHAVREGETCDSVGQCAGLGQDDFLRFNPNLCCEKLFVGQWVCLDATCAD